MSGVSAGGGGGADPILEYLAVIADPTKMQERLAALQQSTAQANEAWERLRKAESADVMVANAEKILADARISAEGSLREAEQALAKANADATLIVSNAKATAEDLTSKAKSESDRVRASAKSARDSAAAKEAKADEILKAAEVFKADVDARNNALDVAEAALAQREASVAGREAEVNQKMRALAGIMAALK